MKYQVRTATLAAVLAMTALPDTAAGQVTGDQLLGWCIGGLGGSVTATADAYQCNTYLQAFADQAEQSGIDLAECLSVSRVDGSALMASLLPELERRQDLDPGSLSAPAARIVGDWIAGQCGDGSAEVATDTTDASDDSADDADPLPPGDAELALEMALWEATQEIDDRDTRIQAIEYYLDQYPDGSFRIIARLQLDDLRRAADAAGTDVAAVDGDLVDGDDTVITGPDQDSDAPDVVVEDATDQDVPVEDENVGDDADTSGPDPAMIAWLAIKDSEDTAELRDYLRQFAETPFGQLARNRIAELEADDESIVQVDDGADATPVEPEISLQDRLQALESDYSAADRRQIQQALADLGFYTLGIDGVFGPGTRRAIRAFQARIGNEATGYLTDAERYRLNTMAPPAAAAVSAPQVPSIRIQNGARTPIRSVLIYPQGYAQPIDLLDGYWVLPGHEYQVSLDRFTGRCIFDVVVVDDWGQQRQFAGRNLCRTPLVSYR